VPEMALSANRDKWCLRSAYRDLLDRLGKDPGEGVLFLILLLELSRGRHKC
jgi:hypothetical protein